MAVFGNVGIRYRSPEDYRNPNEGGGPIRRTPLVATRAHAGNMIYPSPHAIVPDAEPGGGRDSWLWDKKMLPDGRIVPRGSTPNPPYAPLPWSTALEGAPPSFSRTEFLVGLGGGAATGGVLGTVAFPEARVLGSLLGVASGAAFGVLGLMIYKLARG